MNTVEHLMVVRGMTNKPLGCSRDALSFCWWLKWKPVLCMKAGMPGKGLGCRIACQSKFSTIQNWCQRFYYCWHACSTFCVTPPVWRGPSSDWPVLYLVKRSSGSNWPVLYLVKRWLFRPTSSLHGKEVVVVQALVSCAQPEDIHLPWSWQRRTGVGSVVAQMLLQTVAVLPCLDDGPGSFEGCWPVLLHFGCSFLCQCPQCCCQTHGNGKVAEMRETDCYMEWVAQLLTCAGKVVVISDGQDFASVFTPNLKNRKKDSVMKWLYLMDLVHQ